MWTAETRRTYARKGLRYPTDMTDAEWALARPFVDIAQSRPGQRRVDLLVLLLGHLADDGGAAVGAIESGMFDDGTSIQ